MNKYLSEMLGTFILVFFGTGTAVIASLSPLNNVGIFGIAFAFGLTIVAAAYSLGHISGAHLNPAVTFAMFLDKRISSKDLIGYSIFQIIGGFIATTFIWIILHSLKGNTNFGYGENTSGDLTIFGALLVEVILTTIFVFVILSVTKSKFIAPNISVIIIGFTLIMVHLIGIPLTGTSVNPARSIAPALYSGGEAFNDLWIFIIAPLFGSIIAVALYRYFDKDYNS